MTILIFAAFAMLFLDFLQTTYIANHPDKHSETNYFLGKHPSVKRVRVYFGVCFLLLIAASYFIPFVAGIVAIVEVCYVVHNINCGVGLNWR